MSYERRDRCAALIKADAQANWGGGVRGIVGLLTTVRGNSLLLMRLSHAAGRRLPLLGHLLKQMNHVWSGADIAWQARIGRGFQLFHPTGVVIGPGVRIGAQCVVQQGVTLGGFGGEGGSAVDAPSPVLADDVFIGAGARLFGAISVGARARIGANAVVLKDVPSDATAVGVPARLIEPASGHRLSDTTTSEGE